MPKSDTWPSGMSMDSITSVGSAGSCDSMISVSSAFSEGSMEHLSAEERACLMFLEETIESLETEDDSGLSNDELEHQPTHLPSPLIQRSKHDDMLKPPLKIWEMKGDKESKSLFNDIVQPSLVLEDIHKLDGIPVPPAIATTADLPQNEVDATSTPKTSAGKQVNKALKSMPSEINLDFIPPPSDFRDKPAEQTEHHVTAQPQTNRVLEELYSRASLRKPPQPKLPSNDPPMSASSEIHTTYHHDAGEPRASPPAVAPKPKKLPPNIVMKTRRTSESSGGGSPVTSPSERIIMDLQKVRLEALRKVGLLKDVEVDSGPTRSPLHSPKAFRSQESHTPPASPAVAPLLLPPPPTSTEMSEFLSTMSPPSRHSTGTAQQPAKPLVVKSASLEQSAVGLSSYMTNQLSSNSFHRGFRAAASHSSSQSRSRPVSLGNRHDFIGIQGDTPQASTSTNAPHLEDEGKSVTSGAPQQGSGSQRLLRSQGISVLISPRGDAGGDRREALKKLGLLKD